MQALQATVSQFGAAAEIERVGVWKVCANLKQDSWDDRPFWAQAHFRFLGCGQTPLADQANAGQVPGINAPDDLDQQLRLDINDACQRRVECNLANKREIYVVTGFLRATRSSKGSTRKK